MQLRVLVAILVIVAVVGVSFANGYEEMERKLRKCVNKKNLSDCSACCLKYHFRRAEIRKVYWKTYYDRDLYIYPCICKFPETLEAFRAKN